MSPFRLYFLIALFVAQFCAGQNNPPSQPVIANPLINTVNVPTNTILAVNVSDTEANAMTVAYYSRPCPPAPGPDFTIMVIPDTQFYTSELNGGKNAMYKSQMNWIVANRISQNIVFVEGVGDCVQNGDAVLNEWLRVDTCVKIIENPVTTNLTHGMPYGINVGNHDQSPTGTPGGTVLFNQFFGESRFTGRPYYGGHYGSNNNNNYQLFSAGGLDFIVINIEFSTIVPPAVITWMQNLLNTYSNRRAIIGSHNIMSQALQFGAQGQAIYNSVRNYPNVFLMLCGHLSEEGKRVDTYNGNTITTLLSDYQNRTNGGNGWMRIMKFSPANNTISVKTFSPWLNQYETDTNSQFTFNYNMQPATSFSQVGNNTSIPSGSVSSVPLNNLQPNTCYEWYTTVNDGSSTTTSPVWKFTTGNTSGNPVTLNLKVYFEGYYREAGLMASLLNAPSCDTVTIELFNASTPFSKVYSVKGIISNSGNGSFSLPPAFYGGSFYLAVKHRNSLETWSAVPIILNATTVSYDFSTAPNKAYGNKLKNLSDGRFAVFCGDVNQDGTINSVDFSLLKNAAPSFITNYNLYDLTGDNVVESADFSLLENNSTLGIILSRP
jgi:hypothetical protein